MSRSNHNGCGKKCGLCRPYKKWKSNSSKNNKPSVRRKIIDKVGLIGLLFLLGCEGENIKYCGYACKNTGMRMLSYSDKDGCKCIDGLDVGSK